MGDLTEGVQTVISLFKNSSTGIGSSGYEITDDLGNGLTISGNQILVTASLSKDELRDQFGGAQDYDIIIVVRSEEVEDDWIGLTTKSWNEKVILEVNVIDKYSAVATKYITGDLVRYKVVNAIRKFIKAKTTAPGGTINNWQLTRVVNEEDKTTRPITYKAIITTEAWMYYNPNTTYISGNISCATGEQVSNGGLEYGDFSGWVNDRWEVATPATYDTYEARTSTVGATLKQQFNIYVECFTSGSTGQFKWKGSYDACAGTRDTCVLTLTFDNGHTITATLYGLGSWQTKTFVQDILDAVTATSILATDKFIELKLVSTQADGIFRLDDLTIIAEG